MAANDKRLYSKGNTESESLGWFEETATASPIVVAPDVVTGAPVFLVVVIVAKY